MVTLGNYNPYQDLDSWYGVPDYGGAYNSYMGVQQQQLPLSRLISMVQEIQNGMNRRPMGNGAMSVSMPTTAQIPAQIANSLMTQQRRLLSMPRQRWSESGYQPDPNGITPPPATGPGGGSATPGGLKPGGSAGGGSGISGGSNYTPAPNLKTYALDPNFYGNQNTTPSGNGLALPDTGSGGFNTGGGWSDVGSMWK